MHDDLEILHNLTPARVLRRIAALRSTLSDPGSTAGIVAQRLRDGLATREPYAGDGGDLQRIELVWLLGIVRDLDDLEHRACAVRYGCSGKRVSYEALRRVADLREGDGLEIIDVHPRGPDGTPAGPGWVKVRGTRELMPDFGEVGAALGLTARQAQRVLVDARAKIESAIRTRIAAATPETVCPPHFSSGTQPSARSA